MSVRRLTLGFVAAAFATAGVARAAAPASPPPAPREFRAAWVATVSNIDWPSKKGLTTEEQRREILLICDRAAELKLNCLIVQVRPATDTMYPSKLEPWSPYLTGTAGAAPKPYYDPLQMWIDEGHKRGIEIHAWFNPYRARMDAKSDVAPTHVSKTDPEIVLKYGDKLWLDPGEPKAAQRSLDVFNDVTRRYDVDGIHIDDYFYPYPVKDEVTKQEIPFPDDASWNRYKRSNPVRPNPAATNPAQAEQMARADWRRQNVNQLVERIYTSTKQIKPHVKFGISPFGIGRKGKVPGISGLDQYEALYADAALWLQKGWCDYFVPQLYWPIAKKEQSFPVLLDYWRSENFQNRHIWPGLFTAQMFEKTPKGFEPDEIVRQVRVTREGANPGHAHFSMRAFYGDRLSLTTTLKREIYQTPALVPASPWLDSAPPPKPGVKLVKRKTTEVHLTPGRGEKTWVWAIWRKQGDAWSFQTAPGDWRAITVEPGTTEVVVTAVDRVGNESARVSAR